MQTLMVHIVAAFLGILLLAQPQYAWRPQGRFGKRTMELDKAAGLPSNDVDEDMSGFQYPWLKNSFEPVSTPIFHAPGIVCINDGVEGRFLCYRTRTEDVNNEH